MYGGGATAGLVSFDISHAFSLTQRLPHELESVVALLESRSLANDDRG